MSFSPLGPNLNFDRIPESIGAHKHPSPRGLFHFRSRGIDQRTFVIEDGRDA
jgi:hypothetical protein